MELARIKVQGVRAIPVCPKVIPRGITGAEVRFEYTDPIWDHLSKTVVFRGCVTKDVVNAGDVVVIPAEVVARAGAHLLVGVYGVDTNKNVVIPTLWADLGEVLAATDPSRDETTDPHLPVWAQLEARLKDLEKNGTGGGTIITDEQVAQAVEDYLNENGIETASPDWNAEEGQPGHVQNRTHWTQTGLVEVLPETKPVFDENEGAFVIMGAIPTLTVGIAYTINWNGMDYTCVAQDISALMEQQGAIALGNCSIWQEMLPSLTGNDEPFMIATVPGMGALALPYDGSTELTISIYGDGSVVHKLDNKYLDLNWIPAAENGVELLSRRTYTSGSVFKEMDFDVLTAGQLLCAEIDGIRYATTVAGVSGVLAIGNLAMVDASLANTGEPFVAFSGNDGVLSHIAFKDGGTHTLAVYDLSQSGTVYSRIPVGHMPSPPELEALIRENIPLETGTERALEFSEDGKLRIGEEFYNANTGKPGFKSRVGKIVNVDGTDYLIGTGAEVFNAEENIAAGGWSHAEGRGTIALSTYQHVAGRYNAPLHGGYISYLHILGNGSSDTERSNAHTVDTKGVGWFAGGLKVGGTGQTDAAAKAVATEEYVDKALAALDLSGATGGDSATGSDGYTRVSSLAECTDPTKQYVLPNGYIYYCPSGVLTKEITIEEKSGGFWQITNGVPTWTATNGYTGQRTNQIPVSEGETFKYVGRSEWQIPAVVWFDSSGAQIEYVLLSQNAAKSRTSATFVVPSGAAYAQFYTYMGSSGETALTVEYVPFVSTGQMASGGGTSVVAGGVLYGKKYVACGDSFTEGDFTNASADEKEEAFDDELDMYKTYPWWIAQRNGMTLVNEALCGTTMYNNGSANAFSVSRYKEIPADADYITLCFGLNEVNATIGTLDDTTNETVIGAWNVVLEYLITNLPYAKIGIIIPDAWMSSAMRDALISVAQYWGIPYLDLKGDDKIPLLISSKIGYTVNSKAVALRQQAFCVDAASGDTHPNLKGHEYRSTIIENFMRSL